MKITRRILQEIVKEEVQNVLLTEGKIKLGLFDSGKFTGISGYKFHTNPDTWKFDYSKNQDEIKFRAEEEARVFEWTPDGKNDKAIKSGAKGNVFDREIVAADDRNLFQKIKDGRLYRRMLDPSPSISVEVGYNTNPAASIIRNERLTKRDIEKHFAKIFVELIMRAAMENTDFFDETGKQDVTYDDMVEYLITNFHDVQPKDGGARNRNKYGIRIPDIYWADVENNLKNNAETRKIFDKKVAEKAPGGETMPEDEEESEKEEQ